MRHLRFHNPSRDDGLFLVLLENDGEKVVEYNSPSGSFLRIEREGRMFRLQGQDRDTGECVYVPEIEPVS